MLKLGRNIKYLLIVVLILQLQAKLNGQSFFASFNAVGETNICRGDSVAARIWFWGGASPYTVVINGDEGEFLVLEEIESQETFYLKPSNSDRFYMASVRDAKGRKGSASGTVSVEVYQSTPVSIIVDRTAFLETEPGYTLASSPPGADFSGPGVSGNTFYPKVATSDGSPHLITCSYENQNACLTQDRIDLYVLSGESGVNLYSGDEIIHTVCDNGGTYTLKGSNEDNFAGTFELFRKGSSTAIQDHITDDDLNDNEADLSLSGLTGEYEVVYTYGMETLEISASTEFTVYDLGILGIQDLPDTICMSDQPYQLVPEVRDPDPEAAYTFSGTGVYGNQSDGFFLDPGDPVVSPGLNEVVLNYTASNGCRTRLSVMVHMGVLPVISFTPDLICLGPGGSMVSFSNLTSYKESVAEWSWEFGDPASGAHNNSNLENAEHFYPEPGPRTIVLSAITNEGCFAEYSLDTLLVDIPEVDFYWEQECYADDQSISFHASPVSVHSDLSALTWTFKSSGGEVLDVFEKGPMEFSLEYLFPSLDNYDVNLLVQNAAGCQEELSRRIELIPVHVISDEGYKETFEDMADGWKVEFENQSVSWILGVPDFTGFEKTENDIAWYTDLPEDDGEYLEHSWVSTPCFDLSQLSRPIVQMDLMKSFTPGRDGTVVQYKNPGSEGWQTLGSIGGGLNWYKESAISNMPGGSSVGWGLSSFTPDTEWVNAKYSLGELAGNSFVKFRIAIGTGGSQEISSGLFNQGFAFDNFFLGEGNFRRSVLEYFTNASGYPMQDADAMVSDFATKHAGLIYDLHYHMNMPEDDPMNANNPLPPSTRAFNYGVPLVPYAVLNGGSGPEFRYDLSPPSNLIDEGVLIGSSLEKPVFEIFLSVDYQDSKLEGTVTVLCVDDRYDSYLQLYIVVIEKEVTSYPWLSQDSSFRNVVLDMLPTPAGKLLGNNWRSGSVSELDFSWDYVSYIEDVEDLSVVAFVQDRESAYILQADAMPHTFGVNMPGKSQPFNSLVLYPNPAESYTTINFGKRTEGDGLLVLVDISGQEVMSTTVLKGSSRQRLDLSHLPEGLFMVSWKESGTVKGQAKLIRHH